jgi:hypothetical protein
MWICASRFNCTAAGVEEGTPGLSKHDRFGEDLASSIPSSRQIGRKQTGKLDSWDGLLPLGGQEELYRLCGAGGFWCKFRDLLAQKLGTEPPFCGVWPIYLQIKSTQITKLCIL